MKLILILKIIKNIDMISKILFEYPRFEFTSSPRSNYVYKIVSFYKEYGTLWLNGEA